MKFSPLLWLVAMGCVLMPNSLFAQVAAERSERGVVVTIDGQLFAEYLQQPTHQPVVWPIIGPTGEPMTRAYPLDTSVPGENQDHPHQQSLWFSHGDVNGHDFWTDRSIRNGGGNRILHREFVAIDGGGDAVTIVTRNDWMKDDERLCEDRRTLVFAADGDRRWIDFTITLKASDGEVTFGDTKEGTFAVRVAESMKVDAEKGGKIVNREGLTNEQAWGIPSRWVSYTGPIGGETVGFAILSHPDSFRPMVRWHVRNYGLFAANPFGQDDFPDVGLQQGEITIPHGDELTLRYRVLIHRGTAEEAGIEEAYRAFAGEP